jgi:hypothetical protein
MGNEHGRPVDTDGGGNDDPSNKGSHDNAETKKSTPPSGGGKSSKPKKKKPENGEDESDGEKGYDSFLKKMDTSKLRHPPEDPIEKYYNVSDKILGMFVRICLSWLSSRKTGEVILVVIPFPYSGLMDFPTHLALMVYYSS